MKYSIELQGKRKEIEEYFGPIEDKEKMSKKMSDIINYKVRLLEIGFSQSEDFKKFNKNKNNNYVTNNFNRIGRILFR